MQFARVYSKLWELWFQITFKTYEFEIWNLQMTNLHKL